MSTKNKKRLGVCALILCVAAFLAIACILIMRHLPGLIRMLEKGDEAAIEDYIRSSGSLKSVLLTFLLQYIQIVSIVLPGWAIQIPAGIVFGIFYGYLICQLGYIAANLSVFLFARKLGSGINDLVPEGKKLMKVHLLEDDRFPELTVFFACMMPGVPNGIVPYIAARTKITTRNFTVSMALGSFPTILMQCAIGSRILNGDYLLAAVLVVAVLALMGVTYLFRNRLIAFAHGVEERRALKKAEEKGKNGDDQINK